MTSTEIPTNPQNETPDNKSGLSKFSSDHSRTFKWLVLTLAELLILVGVFALGVNVGFHKAGFTYSWATHYPKNIGGPEVVLPSIAPPPSGAYFNGHGVLGQILSLNGTSSLIIKDSDNNEKTILLGNGAVIRQDYQTLQAQNLKANEQIIVIGEPNDQGQIQAKFIRVFDQSN